MAVLKAIGPSIVAGDKAQLLNEIAVERMRFIRPARDLGVFAVCNCVSKE